MLDPLAFALTAEGARLCGKALVELLERFEGRQLATFGASGVPLMQAAIAHGRGRYHGLLIRKEPKAHGARKRVEGPVALDEPVVLIDDTVSSGGSLEAARAALEQEGLFVEGAAVLVRFPWLMGPARLFEQGWHLEAAIDLERDLLWRVEGTPPPAPNPLLPQEPILWSPRQAPEGLTPTSLARLLLEELLAHGQLLRPPAQLDRRYDARGGAIVSIRSGKGLTERHARSGFWRHPGDEGPGAAHEIALACWKTFGQLPQGAQGAALLGQAKVGLTLFGALRETRLGAVDARREGLVIVSQIRTGVQAGALPNLPGVSSAIEQLAHARRMGGLTAAEPVRLLRHTVTKHVEDADRWPVGGAPDALDGWTKRSVGEALTRRARAWVLAATKGHAPPGAPARERVPAGVDYVFLTVFVDGAPGPCVGATPEGTSESLLERLAARALADPRAAGMAGAERLAVELTFLYARLDTGPVRVEDAPRYLRLGRDAVGVVQREKHAILLPAVVAHAQLTRETFLQALLQKAGVTAPPWALQVWRAATWLDDGEQIWPMDGAFPRAPAPGADLAERLEPLLADYLLRNVEEDGRLATHYEPLQDHLFDRDEWERQAFVAWILSRRSGVQPDTRGPAQRMVSRLEGLLPQLNARGASGAAMLLCARCEEGAAPEHLVRALDPHPLDGGLDTGHVLLALAQARARGMPTADKRVEAGLRRLRHRFRYHPLLRDAVLPWAVLAHAAWARAGDTERRVAFVREAIDVALGLQSVDGGFQTTTQEDAPGCTTAPLLEALGASLALGPSPTVRRAFDRGVRFLDGLIYQERDAGVLPNPGFAEGGLRYSSQRATVRIDFVAHALHALSLGKAGGSPLWACSDT